MEIKRKIEPHSFTELPQVFQNLVQEGIVTILPLTKGTKKSAVKWKQYQNAEGPPYPLNKLKQHNGNFGIFPGLHHKIKSSTGDEEDRYLVVLDIDDKKGFDGLYKYFKDVDTLQVKTALKGFHLYFWSKNGDWKFNCLEKMFNIDVELLGNRMKYVLLPPSNIMYEDDFIGEHQLLKEGKNTPIIMVDDVKEYITKILVDAGFQEQETLENEPNVEISTNSNSAYSQVKSTYLRGEALTTSNTNSKNTTDKRIQAEDEINNLIKLVKPLYKEGQRQNLTLYMSGWMLKERLDYKIALKVIKGLTHADSEQSQRLTALKFSYKLEDLEKVPDYDDVLKWKKYEDKRKGGGGVYELIQKYYEDKHPTTPKNEGLSKSKWNKKETERKETIKTLTNEHYWRIKNRLDSIGEIIRIAEAQELGEQTLKDFNIDFSKYAISIFDKLHPGNGNNIFQGWLTLLSSVMGNPIIVIVKGDPGTGKTQITDIIKDFIPNRHIIELNNATESALFTKAHTHGDNYPDKKIFYLKDLGDKNAMESTAPYRKHLRELCSDGITSREISDTQKEKGKHRKVISETLVGYPTMMYSTVRDEEIEQQEIDRAIEITPDLTQIHKIKKIISDMEEPDAPLTKELTELKEEWIPKIQGIFEYLISSPKLALLPFDVTRESYGLRDTKAIVSMTRRLTMVNQQTRRSIGEYIISSKADLVLALTYVQDGGLERTRLQQLYDEYGLSRLFTRDDVVNKFKDSYEGIQASKNAHRTILKPAIEDLDEDGNPLLYEETEFKPYKYYFRREPPKIEFDMHVPDEDYSLLENKYPKLSWEDYYEKNKVTTTKHHETLP